MNINILYNIYFKINIMALELAPSHFELVTDFNQQFGVYIPTTKLPNILTKDPATVEDALKLIREEVKEFLKGFLEHDIVEELDGCIDICYVTLGMCARFGSNMDEVYYNNPMWRSIEKGCITYDQFLSKKLEHIEHAVQNIDYDEVIHALYDMYYGAMAIGKQLLKDYSERMNIDEDKAFDEVFLAVHNNNMSKFCDSEEEAILTVQMKYGNDIVYKSPNYRKAPDNIHWVVYNENPSKVLKSINWKVMSLKHFVF